MAENFERQPSPEILAESIFKANISKEYKKGYTGIFTRFTIFDDGEILLGHNHELLEKEKGESSSYGLEGYYRGYKHNIDFMSERAASELGQMLGVEIDKQMYQKIKNIIINRIEQAIADFRK